MADAAVQLQHAGSTGARRTGPSTQARASVGNCARRECYRRSGTVATQSEPSAPLYRTLSRLVYFPPQLGVTHEAALSVCTPANMRCVCPGPAVWPATRDNAPPRLWLGLVGPCSVLGARRSVASLPDRRGRRFLSAGMNAGAITTPCSPPLRNASIVGQSLRSRCPIQAFPRRGLERVTWRVGLNVPIRKESSLCCTSRLCMEPPPSPTSISTPTYRLAVCCSLTRVGRSCIFARCLRGTGDDMSVSR